MISIYFYAVFFVKEFKQALRDPRMKFILFVAPVIQLILFGVAISTDVKNIRLWAEPDCKRLCFAAYLRTQYCE